MRKIFGIGRRIIAFKVVLPLRESTIMPCRLAAEAILHEKVSTSTFAHGISIANRALVASRA
jgi:hypothetical protein